jgi:phosphoserine phosphatase RsbU/P
VPVRIDDASSDAGFACGEVRGGNGIAHHEVRLPGLRGVIYSRPCDGASGGDIHYLSQCGSGLMARVCLADVAGHGHVVAEVSREIHAHLRRSVDTVDERKVFSRFNQRLETRNLLAMTTAVLMTYYPPRRQLTVCYAGHPRGWLYRQATNRWELLELPTPPPTSSPAFIDIPLGLSLPAVFNRHRFTVAPGDRILLITDGVLETVSPADQPFDSHGIEALLTAPSTRGDDLVSHLIDALHAHADVPELRHDDVTVFVGEIIPGPPGPALWHVFKNRVLNKRIPHASD